jgi:hypothetical protein
LSETLHPNHDGLQGNWIPPAVRRLGEQAERLMREQAAEQNPPAQGEKPAEGEKPPAAREQPRHYQPPAQPQAQPPAQPPQVEQQPPAQTPDWEQRFNTLQGKYNAEIGQAVDRARTAEQRVNDLERRFQQMQVQTLPPPAAKPPTTVEIPAEDIEAYGAELPDAARRWARAEVAPEIQELRQELAQLRGTTQMSQVERNRERVRLGLSGWRADWDAINKDQNFLDWLKDADPMSGQNRSELLHNAYDNGDVNRTAAFFRAFIHDSGKYAGTEHTAAQPSAQTTSHTPAQGGAGPSLQDLAAPGRGRPASPGAPADKRTWSGKEIETFYAESSRGKFRGREAEYARIEAEIEAAMREGRIV